VAFASPALATNEKYSLTVPPLAAAGKTLTGIRGYCAGDKYPAVHSDAFVGGKARVTGLDRFTAEADMVEQTGYYLVYLVCANATLAEVGSVTVF
jgi:hypothetical protein